MRLSGAEIQTATQGIWHGAVPETCSGICTDTRSFQAGDVFLALRGPSFDGHAFAATVTNKALALIGDAEGVASWGALENSTLEVEDTLQALGDIAHAWRMHLSHTSVIAITGSYGKTSLRSMLETGFAALGFRLAATRANLNNLIGVPQTLLGVPADAEIALIECGISEPGEMTRLATMVQPDIAVLTGITAAHSEGLGGLSGVVREKALLLKHVNAGGWCALGKDVAALMQANHIALPENPVSIDAADEAVVSWRLNNCVLMLSYKGEHAAIQLALPARHWAENYAFAASIMLRYLQQRGDSEHTLADITSALSGWQPMAGRMQRLVARNGATVLDDCYNANPVSMQAAINTLCALPGRKVAILGDMAELGEASESAHTGLDIEGLDDVYLIGTQMQSLATMHQKARWFGTTDDAITALQRDSFATGDTVLVKASRSMHLESVVELLCVGEVADAV